MNYTSIKSIKQSEEEMTQNTKKELHTLYNDNKET